MNKEKLEQLTTDLRKEPPRSPREVLGGYVILARCLDKCRAFLLGMNGEYNYWYCSLCDQLEQFTRSRPRPHERICGDGCHR